MSSQATPAPPTTSAAASRDGDIGLSLLIAREYGLLLFWIAVVVVFSFMSSAFLTKDNVLGILNQTSVTAIFAVGEALVIMSGALDLSIAGIAAVSAIVTATLIGSGVPPAIAILGGLATGGIAGAVNGFVVNRLQVSAIVATLGTLSIFTGLALIITNAQPIFGLSGLGVLGEDRFLGVQTPIWIMIGVYIVLGIVMTQTVWGLRLLAVGGNAEASRRAGVSTKSYLSAAFIGSGLCAALAGLVTLGQIGTAEPTPSIQSTFDAITAVALAGVLLSGGRGSIAKVLIGSLLIATVANGLVVLNVDSYYTYVTTGLLLVIAVYVDGLISRTIERRRTAAAAKEA